MEKFLICKEKHVLIKRRLQIGQIWVCTAWIKNMAHEVEKLWLSGKRIFWAGPSEKKGILTVF